MIPKFKNQDLRCGLPAGFLIMGAASSSEILNPHLNGLHINILLATKLQAKPSGSNAQAIKLCPSQHCCQVQATLQVGFDIFV
jgi:hypothetical protein